MEHERDDDHRQGASTSKNTSAEKSLNQPNRNEAMIQLKLLTPKWQRRHN